MSFDFKLDKDTNDLIFVDQDLTFTSKKDEELGQRLKIRLNTFETEWFINQDYGIPYQQEIIGKARNKKDVDTIFLNEIRQEEGVNSIDSFSSTWDRQLRIYDLKVAVVTDDGLIFVDAEISPQDEWEYPDFGDDNPHIDCGLGDQITYANKLYEFINFNGLPKGTYATWWNNWVGADSLNLFDLITQDEQEIITQAGEILGANIDGNN